MVVFVISIFFLPNRSGLLSLDTLANVFVKAICIVNFRMFEQDMPCALEKIIMGELREHVEFGSSTNENISTTTMPLVTKLGQGGDLP